PRDRRPRVSRRGLHRVLAQAGPRGNVRGAADHAEGDEGGARGRDRKGRHPGGVRVGGRAPPDRGFAWDAARPSATPPLPAGQPQSVLAVVGAVIMLVGGASLARAFGIVGVASLVRYRSKVDDPKDAVVMLSALAVGLACGVGLFFLAIFSSLFLVATLWVIE